MQDFNRLRVWERSHRLALRVYAETQDWGRGHGALASQARRAAMSVSANISEGCGKEGAREFARFLEIARASASELEYHLRFAADLGLLSQRAHATYLAEVHGVRRMLTGLLASLRGK
jgi:four helix bundle protein